MIYPASNRFLFGKLYALLLHYLPPAGYLVVNVQFNFTSAFVVALVLL